MAKPLNIGIVGTRGVPNKYGGFEAFAEQLAPWLAARGHRVVVYCSHTHSNHEKMWRGVHRIQCFDPEKFMGAAGQFVYDLNCNLHANKQHFDVVLHLGYTSDAVWHFLWNCAAKHVVNMDGMEWKRAKYSSAVKRFLKWSEKSAAQMADCMIADSTAIEEYLKSKYESRMEYIPYPATIPEHFEKQTLAKYGVEAYKYDLIIARSEPENHIEMAIRAKLKADDGIPLLIFGNENAYRNKLQHKFSDQVLIKFADAEYNTPAINSVRRYCRFYMHGHSAGGTNPSLLEAMACGCLIFAHDNPYNRGVTGGDAFYFSSEHKLADFMHQAVDVEKAKEIRSANRRKIREIYHPDIICGAYEKLFYELV